MTEQLARPVTGNGDADVVDFGGDVYRVDEVALPRWR